LRRLVEHVLPPRFVKIRHYGLYAATHADGLLTAAHGHLVAHRPVRDVSRARWEDLLERLTVRDVRRCPVCEAPLVRIPIEQPRAPPRTA
jgi:hypothetical protein